MYVRGSDTVQTAPFPPRHVSVDYAWFMHGMCHQVIRCGLLSPISTGHFGMELSVNRISGNSVCTYLFYIIKNPFQTPNQKVQRSNKDMPYANGMPGSSGKTW